MISDSKLIDFYKRAVEEFQHPDPEKAVFGRAGMSGKDPSYNKGGRVGLFGVSEKKAAQFGWEDLDNPEQNFRAAMDLDVQGYDTGDLAKMYVSTAGISGGEKPKNNFMVELDSAFDDIRKDIVYDGGEPVSIKSNQEEEENTLLDDVEEKGEVLDETKRQSAGMQSALLNTALSGSDLSMDVESAMELLKAYINKSV